MWVTMMCDLFCSAGRTNSPDREGQTPDRDPISQRLLHLQKRLDIELKVWCNSRILPTFPLTENSVEINFVQWLCKICEKNAFCMISIWDGFLTTGFWIASDLNDIRRLVSRKIHLTWKPCKMHSPFHAGGRSGPETCL